MLADQTAQPTNATGQSSYSTNVSWSVKRALLSNELKKTVKANEKQGITTSVTAYDLTDKKLVYTNDIDFQHYAASTQKIPVVELVLQDLRAGNITFDTPLAWTADDRRDGAGVYDQVGAATTGTVRDVIYDMLNKSSNTAVRVLVNKVLGGAAATNNRLATYPQLKVTRLQPVDESRFLVGYTTARESSFIFNEFYAHTDTYAHFAKDALATNIFSDYGPRSQVFDATKMTVTDKQGQLNDPEGNNRHDIGVIKNKQNGHQILYTLYTTSAGGSETLIVPAEQSLKTMGRSILQYDGDTTAQPNQLNKRPVQQLSPQNGRMIY